MSSLEAIMLPSWLFCGVTAFSSIVLTFKLMMVVGISVSWLSRTSTSTNGRRFTIADGHERRDAVSEVHTPRILGCVGSRGDWNHPQPRPTEPGNAECLGRPEPTPCARWNDRKGLVLVRAASTKVRDDSTSLTTAR